MAVLDEAPHIKARIRVAGELATEYEVPNDLEMIDGPSTGEATTPRKHCYIECKSGAEFAIEVTVTCDFKLPKKNDTVWVSIFIDGARMDDLSILRHELLYNEQVTKIKSSTVCPVDAKRGVVKKFAFAPITKVSHATSLTETGAVDSVPVTVETEDKVRVGSFFFHYRSHEALQREILSYLSESDIRRLAMERLRDNKIKQESAGVKREADESSPTPRSWKFVKLGSGKEAIDLTDE
ncbi:hypothetical protein FLONG3_8834 [Fusarium longipes]|uniref:DUF7918 domain-containing protein n=1 Tax=Fusarium longipes TaxID=694270 RepID=A0A395S2F7_9HYPO|nr:hypothetical protein FLONG3_8834 [Fusarium longipes]